MVLLCASLASCISTIRQVCCTLLKKAFSTLFYCAGLSGPCVLRFRIVGLFGPFDFSNLNKR